MGPSLMSRLGILCSSIAFSFSLNAKAENAAEAAHFEIIDGSASISGEPDVMTGAARERWKSACEIWKAETKELNKSDRVMEINCGSPSCHSENAGIVCTSTGNYKIKTAGIRENPAPVASAPAETVIQTAPPPVIVEAAPRPRIGFTWIVGYWAWSGHRHVWRRGHWVRSRPGHRWSHPRWVARDRGWHFEKGHWRRRR